MREGERFICWSIYIYIYISIIFVGVKIDRLIQKQDKCDCYLIRRGFDRELMHAINMKIIVYGVCVYRLKINFLKYIRTTVWCATVAAAEAACIVEHCPREIKFGLCLP